MSSILIKGMEMPKNCSTCPCFQYNMFDDNIDGYCKTLKVKITDSDEHHPNCPLVEIPTPCERLIDINTITAIYFSDADGEHCVSGERLYDLEIEADTIIEVERREE